VKRVSLFKLYNLSQMFKEHVPERLHHGRAPLCGQKFNYCSKNITNEGRFYYYYYHVVFEIK